MRFSVYFIAAVLVAFVSSSSVNADLHTFRLTGAAGDGLLEGNINPPTGEVGTGGMGLTGITYDDATNILHIDVIWGSAFGFNDLSSDVLKLHLHGATASSAPNNFGQTAPLLIVLSNSLTFDNSLDGGGVNDNFFLNQADEAALLQGRMYVNVHLSETDTGVIRGYVVRNVPEPTSLILLACGTALTAVRRRRMR